MGRPCGKGTDMDVFEILEKDHKETLSRFRELERTSSQESAMRSRKFGALNAELLAHLQAEEDTFYPPLMKGMYREDALEAVEEHHAIELVLKDLRDTQVNTETWKPKLKVLKEILEHHIEEEEGKIFAEIETLLTSELAIEMGTRFSAKKTEILIGHKS